MLGSENPRGFRGSRALALSISDTIHRTKPRAMGIESLCTWVLWSITCFKWFWLGWSTASALEIDVPHRNLSESLEASPVAVVALLWQCPFKRASRERERVTRRWPTRLR
jgi:hypothetical protein